MVELDARQRMETVNTHQLWEAWRAASKRNDGYAGSLVWRSPQRGGEYLVHIEGGRKNRQERSLGLRSAATERLFKEFRIGRKKASETIKSLFERLSQQARVNLAYRLGRVPSTSSRVLRRLSREGLLGSCVSVISTHALYAFEAATAVMFDPELMTTDDLDLTIDTRARLSLSVDTGAPARVLDALRGADRSFRQTERSTSAVNDDGFVVDLVRPGQRPVWKGRKYRLSDGDLSASTIDDMRWVANAPKFESVAIGADGLPVPLVTPDPRAFATYKMHMGTEDPRRLALKRTRDVAQARAVAHFVISHLPHLPFEAGHLRFFPLAVTTAAGEKLENFFRA